MKTLEIQSTVYCKEILNTIANTTALLDSWNEKLKSNYLFNSYFQK